MAGIPAILLKRSDGPYYRVHFGTDFEAVGASFNDFAFTVHAVLVAVRTASDAPVAIDKGMQAMPLRNGWFKSDSLSSAASILHKTLDLQALGLAGEALAFGLKSKPGEPEVPPLLAEAAPMAPLPEAGETVTSAETTDTDNGMDAREEAQIWEHVVPCSQTQDANTAAEIRRDLIHKLGKPEAKRILNSCITTVAKNGSGQKSRVLKANGKLLKLKPAAI